MEATIYERARALVDACPAAVSGQGGHAATFRVAAALVWGFALSPEEAFPFLQGYNLRCDPPWKDYELWHKLRSALATTHQKPRGHLLNGGEERGQLPEYERPAQRAPVTYDAVALTKVAAKVPEEITDAWLAARSPVDPATVDFGGVLDAIYEPDDKVMVFGSMRSLGDWMRWRGRWFRLGKEPGEKAVAVDKVPERTREGMIFAIQPQDGQWHRVQGQTRLSRRTQASIARFAFMLLESDEAPRGQWLKALVQLPLPIVAIVSSGGRSVHALVNLHTSAKADWLEMVDLCRDVLAAVGCDTQALRNPSVNCRAPGVWREGKMKAGAFVPYPHGATKQKLLYLSPRADNKPIIQRAIF